MKMSARGNMCVQCMASAILLLTIISQHVLFVESFANPSDRHVSIQISDAATRQVSPATHSSLLTTIISPIELRKRRTTKLEVSGSISSESETTSSNDEGKNEKLPSLFPKKPKKASSSSSSSSSSDQPTSADDDDSNGNEATKFRTLKDFMWRRDTLEDLAAAEFACSVEASDDNVDESSSSSSLEANGGTRRKRRAVDYEKLVTKLNKRIQDMLGGRRYIDENGRALGGQTLSIVKGRGMGRVVYTEAQRTELLKRILATRETLLEFIKRSNLDVKSHELPFGIQLPEIPEIRVEIPKEEESVSAPGPKVYVRDDGTLDWDGALQDRAALQKFGSAVWQRINGQEPTSLDEKDKEGADKNKSQQSGHGHEDEVTAKIQDTPQIRLVRAQLAVISEELKEKQESHAKLLASAIRTGSASSNVNLASLDPVLRNKIQDSAEELDILEQKLSFQTLVYELERIYTYLATELGNPSATGYVPLQDRLNVAEFGLLESQIESFHRDIDANDAIDEDVLAVVNEQLTDFKRRLGIDYYVKGLTLDGEAIRMYAIDLFEKSKNGIAFYVKGCRLFWDDLLYCTSLIIRAAQGYTLKPREVRNIRRTFKDIITFIPFIIILLIPLSPIGHVLVFGAIQRFFPDFFPSCFTETRQNLLQLYETTEYTEFKIKETLQDKVYRVFEAASFFIYMKSMATISRWSGQPIGGGREETNLNGSSISTNEEDATGTS